MIEDALTRELEQVTREQKERVTHVDARGAVRMFVSSLPTFIASILLTCCYAFARSREDADTNSIANQDQDESSGDMYAEWHSPVHYLIEALMLFILTFVNIFVTFRDMKMRGTFLLRRAMIQIDAYKKRNCTDSVILKDVHGEITVQRHGENFKALENKLVSGDQILIPLGASFPEDAVRVLTTNCTPVSPSAGFSTPEVCHGQDSMSSVAASAASGHGGTENESWLTQYQIVTAPGCKQLRDAFNRREHNPPTLMQEYSHAVLRWYTIGVWIAFVVSFIASLICYYLAPIKNQEFVTTVLAQPAYVLATPALLSLSALLWAVVESYCNARLLALFRVLQTADGRDQSKAPEDREASRVKRRREQKKNLGRVDVPIALVRRYFVKLFGDHSPAVMRCSNMFQTLGAVTACVFLDKDATLTEPIPQPERLYMPDGELGTTLSLSTHVAEDSSVTLSFDDKDWANHISVLKPIGLTMLLQRPLCRKDDAQNAPHILNMTDLPPAPAKAAEAAAKAEELAAKEGATTEQVRAAANEGKRWKDAFVDLTRSYSRPYNHCLCLLTKEIGFAEEVSAGFERLMEIHTYASVSETLAANCERDNATFAKVLAREPLYMCSLAINDIKSGSLQLLSKGNAPTVLGHCESFWDGHEVREMTPELRAAIIDHYTHLSDAYTVVAFAYKPIPRRQNDLFTRSSVDVRVTKVDTPGTRVTNNADEKKNIRNVMNHSGSPNVDPRLLNLTTTTTTTSPKVVKHSPRNKRAVSGKKLLNRVWQKMTPPSRQSAGSEGSDSAILGNSPDASGPESHLGVELKPLSGDDEAEEEDVHGVEGDDDDDDEDEEDINGDVDEDETPEKKRRHSHRHHSHHEHHHGKSGSRRHHHHQSHHHRHASRVNSASHSSGEDDSYSARDDDNHEHEHEKMDSDASDANDHSREQDDGDDGNESEPVPVYVPITRKHNERHDLYEDIQTDQIFLGMAALRDVPRNEADTVIEALQNAGVHFMFFSSEDQKRSTFFASKLGLETDWNCVISLKDSPQEPYMNDTSKLPRGISRIRDHIKTVDTVPLRVPVYCDCTPESSADMIKILQENGDVVLCVGSAIEVRNTPAFAQANISMSIQPEPDHCILVDNAPTNDNELLSSCEFPDDPSTGNISADLTSLPCNFIMHQKTSFSTLSTLLCEGRHVLRATTQAALTLVSLTASLHFTIFFGALLYKLPLFAGYHVLWLACIIVPILSLSILTGTVNNNVMKQLNGKSVINRSLIGHTIALVLTQFIPIVLFVVAQHFVTLGGMFNDWYFPFVFSSGLQEAESSVSSSLLFSGFNLSSSFVNDSSLPVPDVLPRITEPVALMYAQNITMLTFVLGSFVATFILSHPSLGVGEVWKMIRYNKGRTIGVIVVTILQLLFFVISLVVTDKFAALAMVPWWSYVLLVGVVPVTLGLGLLGLSRYHSWWESYQLELKLVFDTKLGMYSPVAKQNSNALVNLS